MAPLESELSLQRDVQLVSLDGQMALKRLEHADLERKIVAANERLR